jgi:hypothetical protein
MPIIKIYGCKDSDFLKNKKTVSVPEPHGSVAMREKVREAVWGLPLTLFILV